ncbi:MAG: hypothetical protein MZW92_37160 [Comamonadaceae bacterium]|nr:hypothetical protein [Comamonadaceae bacterium]
MEAEAGEAALSARARVLSQPTLQHLLDTIHQEWKRLASLRQDIFQTIRRHVLAEMRDALSSDIELFLAAERKCAPARLHRLLDRAAWRTCAALAGRVTTAEFHRLFRRRLAGSPNEPKA